MNWWFVFFFKKYIYTYFLAISEYCSSLRETADSRTGTGKYQMSLKHVASRNKNAGVGNGNPLQDCCLEKSMDRGAWQATAHGVTKSQHNWAAEHKHRPTLIQIDLLSKSTVTCTKIVFPNQVLFVGSGGYNLGISLGPLLNLLQSGKEKKKKKNEIRGYSMGY